jgi:hypothetical protein
MTTGRRQRKQRGVDVLALACLVLLPVAAPAVDAATTERIVSNWHTGLAIDGYDPVAFYTEGKAVPGSPDFELLFGDVVWRFCNLGNREAFAAHPDVYMPRFGGYDPLGVARGVAVTGVPSLWAISGGRLFLFHDRRRLDTFTADAERIIAAAERKWPEVLRTLSP